VDARMSGSSLPVMTNAGSGNQGIVITLPIVVVARRLKRNSMELARALALGHLFAAYSRMKMGVLSTICGSAVAGSIGASVGILWLVDKRTELVPEVVKNVIASVAGIFCGGAKGGECALKLATAGGVAVETAFLTMNGLRILAEHSVIAESVEQNTDNLGLLSRSMRETEQTILSIMMSEGS